MKHRVELDISFDEEKDAKALMSLIEKFKHKAFKDDPIGKELYQVRTSRYTLCGHDETPPKPCSGYINIDFDGPEVTHTYNTFEEGVDEVTGEPVTITVATTASADEALDLKTKQEIFKVVIDKDEMPELSKEEVDKVKLKEKVEKAKE